MVAVPVLKLFTLTVKTLAKPMSKRLKTEAQKHPTFRGVLNNMGQLTHVISTRISIRNAGHTTTKIKPLEEGRAIADGGDLLAEGFIYGLGAFLMVFEYVSSANEKEAKEAKAKLKKEEEKRELAQTLDDINHRLAKIEALNQRHDQTSGKGGDNRSAPPGADSKGPGQDSAKDSEDGGPAPGGTTISTGNGNPSSTRRSGTATFSRPARGLERGDAVTGDFRTPAQRNENAVGKNAGDGGDGDRSREQARRGEWDKRASGPPGVCYLGLTPTSWNWATAQLP